MSAVLKLEQASGVAVEPTIAEVLGEYAANFRYEDIPGAVLEQARYILLDGIGIAFASTNFEFAQRAYSALGGAEGEGGGTVIGMPGKLPMRDAVMMNSMLVHGLTCVAPQSWDRTFVRLAPLLPRAARAASPGDKLHKLARVLAAADPGALYSALVSLWPDGGLVRGADGTSPAHAAPHFGDVRASMMYLDAMEYLPDDILAKVDRASMAVSLESRAPLLDHSVAEFAWRLPLSMKMRDNQGKWLLRQVLYQYVPRPLIERTKMGFSVPLDTWLRGPLRHWAEALLDESTLQRQGYFDPHPIREKWREHLSGTRNWQHPLWVILMFQAWLEKERTTGTGG